MEGESSSEISKLKTAGYFKEKSRSEQPTQHISVQELGALSQLIYLQVAIQALDQNISSVERFEGQSFFNYNQFGSRKITSCTT